MRHEERLKTEVRKWGHSLGLIIPTKFAKKLDLKEHGQVEIKLKKVGGAEELFGRFKFGRSTKKIIKEIKEGWKD